MNRKLTLPHSHFSEKPGFRSWGGKRSVVEPLNSKLNDYLKRLEALDMLLSELDSQNYD